MTGEQVDDLLTWHTLAALDQLCGSHQDARGAESALQGVVLAKRRLQGMEVSVRGEPFDRLEGTAVGLHREQQAGADGGAVKPDRAGAAHAVLAADVRPREAESVTDEVREQKAGLHIFAVGAAVDGQLDGDHAAARSHARVTARKTSVATRLRR